MNTDTILLLILGGDIIVFLVMFGIFTLQEGRTTKTMDNFARDHLFSLENLVNRRGEELRQIYNLVEKVERQGAENQALRLQIGQQEQALKRHSNDLDYWREQTERLKTHSHEQQEVVKAQ